MGKADGRGKNWNRPVLQEFRKAVGKIKITSAPGSRETGEECQGPGGGEWGGSCLPTSCSLHFQNQRMAQVIIFSSLPGATKEIVALEGEVINAKSHFKVI